MPSTPPPRPPSRVASARIGAVLFRNRSWLPVPFVLVALLAPAHTRMRELDRRLRVPSSSASGFASPGVAAAGTVTRRRSRDVQRLVTYGIFRWVRNPLYVGNFLIWMGFVVISGVLWFLPVAILLFAIEYTLIVAYEEGVLESIFGQEYLDYKQTTPRWIPASARAAERWAARLGRGVAQRDQHVHAVRRARSRRSRSSSEFGGCDTRSAHALLVLSQSPRRLRSSG